ncbi:MAG: hypothetical protein IJR55_01925 [Clostridia bacterium]|nr:hypothetical protein [Clostridia bacterium]
MEYGIISAVIFSASLIFCIILCLVHIIRVKKLTFKCPECGKIFHPKTSLDLLINYGDNSVRTKCIYCGYKDRMFPKGE